jgi:hypothetical protein
MTSPSTKPAISYPTEATRPISRTRKVTFKAACRSYPLRARRTTAQAGGHRPCTPYDALARRTTDPPRRASTAGTGPWSRTVDRPLVARGNRRVRYRGVTNNDARLHTRTAQRPPHPPPRHLASIFRDLRGVGTSG